MNKLLITLVCAITFTPHIFSMEENSLQQVSQALPYKCSKKILLELSQNCHRYADNYEWNCTKSALVSRIIFNVSLVNKDLYQELDKQRNDPITARSIIINTRHQYLDDSFASDDVENFVFPGAKKCRELTAQLYDDNLTEDMVEKLFHQGATIDYDVNASRHTVLHYPPLFYWGCISHKNEEQSKAIIKKLLDLGANPDKCDVLTYVIDTENIDLTKMILNYKPVIKFNTWRAVSVVSRNMQEYIDLLLPCATQDELNDGLYCFACNSLVYKPEIMQKFIDNGANPSIALHQLITRLTNFTLLDANHDFIKIFNFLCSKGAFDKKALTHLQHLQDILGSLINELDRNQPSDPFGMEQ